MSEFEPSSGFEADIMENEDDDQQYLQMMTAYRKCKLEGQPRAEVAAELKVTTRTISRYCAKVSDHLREQMKEEVITLKASLASRYEFLYEQAIKGWRRSQEKKVETTSREVAGEGDQKETLKTTKEIEQAGMPAFLSVAAECLESIEVLYRREMDAAERKDGSNLRAAGKSQRELIEQKIGELQKHLREMDMRSVTRGDRA